MAEIDPNASAFMTEVRAFVEFPGVLGLAGANMTLTFQAGEESDLNGATLQDVLGCITLALDEAQQVLGATGTYTYYASATAHSEQTAVIVP